MFCTNCSKPLPPDGKFCPSCGQGVSHDGSVPASPAAGRRSFMMRLREMKTWKKVVIGLAIVIVGAIGLAMFATSDLDKPVQRHFAALRAGDMIGAYSELSIAARQQTSQEAFKTMVEGTPAFARVTGHTFSSRSLENGQGRLEGTLELEGGGKLPIEINLVKENDLWKILGYRVPSANGGEK